MRKACRNVSLRDNEEYESAAMGKQVLTLTQIHTIRILGFPNTYQTAESLSYVTNACWFMYLCPNN